MTTSDRAWEHARLAQYVAEHRACYALARAELASARVMRMMGDDDGADRCIRKAMKRRAQGGRALWEIRNRRAQLAKVASEMRGDGGRAGEPEAG